MAEPLHVVGAVIVDEGRCLVAQRGPGMAHAGKWEFPGGKVERGERAEAALAREIREELDVEIDVADWIGRGEAIQRGTYVTLDVYRAELRRGTLRPREHARTRWVAPSRLYPLDWCAADVPVLPAVRATLDAPNAGDEAWPRSVLSADWAKETRKRAVWSARQTDGAWILEREPPPPRGWDFSRVLERGRRREADGGGPVLVGLDVAIGLPFAFTRAAGYDGFIDGLARLGRSGGLTHTCTDPAEWAYERPFFAVPKGRGGLSRFVEKAGGRGRLVRQIDLQTGGKTAFAVRGIPGTVGSGSRSMWAELVTMIGGEGRDFGLWPFDGPLRELLRPGRLTIGETYPRAAYAVALADALPTKPRTVAKTRRGAREAAVERLRRSPWLTRHAVDLRDVDIAVAAEDDFDAMMAAAAIVRSCVEGHSISSRLVDPGSEGGILATAMVEPRTSRPPAGLRLAADR